MTIGIDHGDVWSHYRTPNQDGEVVDRGRFQTTAKAIEKSVCGMRGSDFGKMDVQLIAKEENQDGAQRRKNEAGWMISFVPRARKHVGNGTAEDRSYDAENDRPEEGHMHVHY